MIIIAILLNVVAIICIVISLLYINRFSKKENCIYEEILSIYSDIRYYFNSTENIIDDFNDLISNSLNKVENIQDLRLESEDLAISDDNKINISSPTKSSSQCIMNEINKKDNSNKDIYIKVIELKKSGLSNKEIAKKVDKGVREVEIIIKMLENVYTY